MIYKFGENLQISNVIAADVALADPRIEEHFKKFAAGLKRIAPKANDFLYFSAVMMHAAEAALINPDGSAKILPNGKKAEGRWDINEKTGSWKWISNDPSVLPFKNANGDIFPEEQLLKAYRKWVEKPLCIDHKSNSVDHVRGVIVDTYYDYPHKRVIALCALDKVNHPDLARKVMTGVSNNVSMGTAVAQAICFDCGAVAKTERDFCRHMISKSGYGEINVGLSPIELSIVVNGADPYAKIKHIIASANHLNHYIETKETEFNNASADKVHEIKEQIVSEVKKGLASLISEFEKSSDASDKKAASEDEDVNNAAYRQSSGEIDTTDVPGELGNGNNEILDTNSQNYANRIASSENNNVLVSEFYKLKSELEQKIATMEKDLKTLSKSGDGSREMTMDKKSYYQGAGGVNEPTPGTPKYEKDPLNEKDREEDKHMNGETPFPSTGPVDGLHPGDLERKKLLARAEADERAARRKSAVAKAKENLANKQAYFQGGGGVNEPKPGKYPYAKEDADSIRDKEDKQMTGQPPFPEVGKVDGLHPSPASVDVKDELKRKELLQRASLKAKFVKAAKADGSDDQANSAWQIFANDKLVLTATVKELSAGRVDAFYDVIATREFGTKMLDKVKSEGFEKAAAVYKSAQMAAPAAPEAPEAAPAPSAAPEMSAPAPEAAEDPMAALTDEDKGGDGDPAAIVDEKLENIQNEISDVKEKVKELKGSADEAHSAVAADTDEVNNFDTSGLSATTASLHKMRRELNEALLTGLSKNAQELSDHLEELSLLDNLYQAGEVNSSNVAYVNTIATDAMNEAKAVMAESMELFEAFVKYAQGSEAVIKRASKEHELVKSADGMTDDRVMDDAGHHIDFEDDDAELTHKHKEDDEFDKILNDMKELEEDEHMYDHDDHDGDHDENDAATMVMPEEQAKKYLVDNPNAKFTVDNGSAEDGELDLTTKAGRTAYRAKLAASTQKWDPMLQKSHAVGLDQMPAEVEATGDLGKVETVEEVHQKMMDIATAPPKVRKDAEKIMELVKSGRLAAADVDQLVAHGVDPEAVKYWHALWDQSKDGGREFAGELLKDYDGQKKKAEMDTYKVKIARAYDLAYQMVARGLCGSDTSVIAAQAEEIVSYNDEAFESLKRVIARHPVAPMSKTASIPYVGINHEEPVKEAEQENMVEEYKKLFAGRRY